MESVRFIFKQLVCGEGAVGKTSLVIMFTEKKFKENYIMTIGSNFALKSVQLPEHDTSVKLQIWDLSGQVHFKAVRASFYTGGNGVIYVYDITRAQSLQMLASWKKEVDKHSPGIPCIVLGNKADLEERRQVSTEEGRKVAEQMGAIAFYETSAKTGQNVEEAFHVIAREMYERALARAEGKHA
ncbi:MAG: Rab family GTPase [Promethearchaeota archaeon]